MRNRSRLLTWLLLAPLAFNAAAGEISKSIPEIPGLPAAAVPDAAASIPPISAPAPISVVDPAAAVVPAGVFPAPAVQALAAQSENIDRSLSADPSGAAARVHLENLYSGGGASDGAASAPSSFSSAFDPFSGERVRISPEQAERVHQIETVLVAAVREAAAAVIPREEVQVLSRGSTSRGTYIKERPDYDISVRLPRSWSSDRFEKLGHGGFLEFRRRLTHAIMARAGELPDHVAVHVQVQEPIRLGDPATNGEFPATAMIQARVFNAANGVVADADVTLTGSDAVANPYPELFASQIAQVKRLGGDAAVNRILDDIRLAKRFFKEAVNAYRPWEGGPSAVGIEQMVLQSGRTQDGGKTILEVGGFDALMEKIAAAAFAADGGLRLRQDADSLWYVHNPYMKPGNFTRLIQQQKWERLANLVRVYLKSRQDGKRLRMSELRTWNFKKLRPAAARVEAPARPAAPASTVGQATLQVLDRFTLSGPRPGKRGDSFLYAQGAKALPAELEAAAKEEAAITAGEPAGKAELLIRRGESTYVLRQDGGRYKRYQLDPDMVQGLPSESPIELFTDKDGGEAARPLGGLRADVIIGRAAIENGKLTLQALLRDKTRPQSLYQPMPIESAPGLTVTAGDILQVYVRRTASGFSAVPLESLGRALTPEIAAREIALRHGARGYFPRDVIEQAEAAAAQEAARPAVAGGRFEDLRSLPFVTIDPDGAGDLDDAFWVERDQDGGYTWILATSDVSRYVAPGTPAFKTAARLGNTFYSIDKDGVPDYPMNHPVVSKYLASLLNGKDSYAMITRMKFDADGRLLREKSKVSLGVIHVQGRYSYDQVARMWADGRDHGVAHAEMIALARELAAKLSAADEARGKLKLNFDETARIKDGGYWKTVWADKSPLVEESHRLIEELKVYGNLVITERLNEIVRTTGVPQIQRSHPPQNEKKNKNARQELEELGVPWNPKQSLPDFLKEVHARRDLSHEAKQLIQLIALRSRNSAIYARVDGKGHEGLALNAGEYDHPSAPIRRFADMYNRALLEAYLEGGDVRAVHARILDDLRSLGFKTLDDYLAHLNAREQAARQMDYEMSDFMNIFELSQPRNLHRPLKGYVKMSLKATPYQPARAVIQISEPPVEYSVEGREAEKLRPLDRVEVTVHSADPETFSIKATVR